MKATMFAVVLSLFVVSIPVFASSPEVNAPSTVEHASKTINLNKADVSELTQSFKGIGQKRAQAIVAYRDAHGAFKSVAELAEVRGLGQSFVNNHLPQLQALFVLE